MPQRYPQPQVTARRAGLPVCVLLAVLAALPAGAAESCGSMAGARLRWVVPNSSGGGYDGYTRLLQPHLERELGATVVVENRPDAGGVVAAALIRDAAPDGRTLGIVNAAGLLAASLDREVPDPAADFTILARIATNRTVMLAGRDSAIGNVADLLSLSARRPIVIGVRDAGSASLFAIPVVAELLGMKYALITGYVGNNARVLAAIRGDVDLLVQNLDSTRAFIESGELRPLLLLTQPSAPAAYGPDNALIAGIPALGGANGMAAERARLAGRAGEDAVQKAQALARLIDAGRLVVAPPALPDGPRRCLENALAAALASKELRTTAARARLTLDTADAVAARADVEAAAQALGQLAPIIRPALQHARE